MATKLEITEFDFDDIKTNLKIFMISGIPGGNRFFGENSGNILKYSGKTGVQTISGKIFRKFPEILEKSGELKISGNSRISLVKNWDFEHFRKSPEILFFI